MSLPIVFLLLALNSKPPSLVSSDTWRARTCFQAFWEKRWFKTSSYWVRKPYRCSNNGASFSVWMARGSVTFVFGHLYEYRTVSRLGGPYFWRTVHNASWGKQFSSYSRMNQLPRNRLVKQTPLQCPESLRNSSVSLVLLIRGKKILNSTYSSLNSDQITSAS